MRRRIAVTLSIFIFSSWFLAQFVENCEGHLSRPFLSTGDNFSKSYDENQIWVERNGGTDAPRRRVQIPESARVRAGSNPRGLRGLRAAAPRKSGFRHNFSKNYPQYLKMV